MYTDALTSLAPDLWVATRPLRLWVGDVGCRMTVIRLRDGSVLVHSPVPLDGATREGLDSIGPVRWIVAPSKVHHLYAGEYVAAYPDADLCGAPGLARKRPDLTLDHVLGEEGSPLWPGELETHSFRGAPALNEVVFLHRPTRTLILTDLAFNVPRGGPNRARVLHWLVGATGRFGPHRLVRSMIRDRPAARRSVDEILQWDFDRVVVSHGEVLETGGRQGLQKAFAFLKAR